jgi:hypothetical protein
MTTIQLVADAGQELDAARLAVIATRFAEVMGLYTRPQGRRIDRRLVGEAINAAAASGIGEHVAVRSDASEPGRATTLAFLRALEASPRPAAEIPALAGIFGYSTLEHLAGASEASLRRYATETRTTPDPVARRTHYLAELVAILRGSFNEFGIRRWFERGHPALDGRLPSAVLGSDFDPDDPPARQAMAAATSLLW